MILAFILGIIVGLLTIPLIIILHPNKRKKIRKELCLNLTLEQKKLINKSLLACTDLNWLNVLISRFWLELSESQAQAYRLKSYMSKWFEMANLNLIKNFEIIDVNIDREAPVVESIRIVTPEGVEEMGLKREERDKNVNDQDFDLNQTGFNDLNQTSSNDINQTSFNDSNNSKSFILNPKFNNVPNHGTSTINPNQTLNDNRFYEKIFNNVNTLLKIKYEGQIIIKMKIQPLNNFTFNINVHITKVEGQVLLRLPSLHNNSKIEYTFMSQPKIDISVDAGLSRNEGKEYLKNSLSNFIRRTIRFFIYKFFVYPSFNNLALPLITPNFTKYLHKISKVTDINQIDLIENMKKSLDLICLMDYKFAETFKGITISKNNHLINEKDKITRLNFPIPERTLTLKTQHKFLYEGLTIKESRILNFIYDLEIFKEVFPSFKKIFTKFNLTNFMNSSLIEIQLSKNTYEFVRIVDKNTIYFQKNDEEDPEFIIFKIDNKQLFIYYFVNKELAFTKKRMMRLIGVFNDKPQSKLISFYNLLKLPKEAYKYFKKRSVRESKEIERLRANDKLNIDTKLQGDNGLNADIKNFDIKTLDSGKLRYKEDPFEDNSLVYNNITEIFTKYISNPNLLELRKVLHFDYPPFLIKKILTEEIRLRLHSESSKIYKERIGHSYKSLIIENPDGKDFIMHTMIKDNVIMDIINRSKFIFVLEGVRKLSNLENVSFLDIHKITQGIKKNEDSSSNNVVCSNGQDNNKVDNKMVSDKDNEVNNRKMFNGTPEGNNNLSSKHNSNPLLPLKSRLKIYSDNEYGKNYLLESIHTRLRHQELLDFIQNYEFTKICTSKSIKKSFYGDTGGVFIEFKTLEPDDFRLILLEQSKKVFLDIHKIITTRPFVLVLPISNFTLKLYPKYKINDFLELKIVNLPFKYANESLINCDIGLNRNQKFLFPFLVSDNTNDLIIYWEKEESVSGYLRNKETTVEIKGNGNIRADEGEYSIIYKNNGKKKRNIKIFMGCTRR